MRMKYICTILLICGLFMGQAVGQDVTHCINGDCFDAGGNSVEMYSIYATDSGNLVYDSTNQVKAYPHAERAEIRAILERCRELNRISRDMWEKGTPFYVKSLNLEFDIDEMIGRLE